MENIRRAHDGASASAGPAPRDSGPALGSAPRDTGPASGPAPTPPADTDPALGPAPTPPADTGVSGSPRRHQVLDLVRAAGSATVADIAERTGHHQNTARQHLDGLVAAGLLRRETRRGGGRGRPVAVYLPTTRPAEHAALAAVLAGQIARSSTDPAADALAAGEAWGHQLVGARTGRGSTAAATGAAGGQDPRRTVLELLDALGFAPRADPVVASVSLCRCPLLDVARQWPDVVCTVHLGLVRAALADLGGDPEPVRLIPFAEPGACRLTLAEGR